MRAITEYIVEVGYKKFHFAEAENAVSFAQTAARTVTECETVEIHLITETEDADVC